MKHTPLSIKLMTMTIDGLGITSWKKIPTFTKDPTLGLLWDKDFQNELINRGYQIKITPPQVIVSNLNKQKTTPEVITLMSPEYIAKENIRSKMRKEFE